MKMELPIHVSEIIETLNMAGYEAYAVGGCVRDTLLGVPPKDWDITSSALPLQIKELFPRTIDTGIQHGTVTVMMDKIGYEVTTYRVDGEYEDGRHPKQVQFTASLLEDLKRRDFTINAMAYHPRTGLVDAFDGISDLERKEIRCVGEAVQRFGEDALRILRAVRFSAQLNCSIEESTLEGMKKLAPNLTKVSVERIYMELSKLLLTNHPEKLRYAFETGLIPYILPELGELDSKTVDEMLRQLVDSRKDLWVRLGILLSYAFAKETSLNRTARDGALENESGQEETASDEVLCRGILRRLKTDLQTIKTVSKLVENRNIEIEMNPVWIRRFLSMYGQDFMDKWISYVEVMRNVDLLALREEMNRVLERGDCLCMKQLAVDGATLKELGVPQGKEIGETLSRLLEEVLVYPEKNTKEELLALIGK